MSAAPRVVLASRSPARLTTLRAAGIDPEVVVSGFDEDSIDLSDPAELVAALARAKAESVAAGLPEGAVRVIGCDSVRDFEGEVPGQPSSRSSTAASMSTSRSLPGSSRISTLGSSSRISISASRRRWPPDRSRIGSFMSAFVNPSRSSS